MSAFKATKKPVEIEVFRFTAESKTEATKWCDGNLVDHQEFPVIQIYTLEGVMCATVGDYIIKGVNGEFYPCKPDIFDKTYNY